MIPTNVLRLVMCFFVAGAAFYFQERSSESKTPLWTAEAQQDPSNYAGVSFLNNEQLLAYETDRTGQLSSRKSPEIASAFRLHLSLLDTRSGVLTMSRDWGTRPYNNAVQVTTGGVLVQTGEIVKLYSPDFTQVRDLPFTPSPKGTYSASVSVSGHTILISDHFQKDHRYVSHIDVVDASSLQVRHSWDQYPPIGHFSMSDEKFATVRGGTVTMTEFGRVGRSQVLTVLDTSKQRCAAGGSAPGVVSDELIVLRDCTDVLLLTAAGETSSLEVFNGRGTAGTHGVCLRPHSKEAHPQNQC